MYAKGSQRVLAFHGCDRLVGEDVLSGRTGLLPSENDYDWLGHGIYFWENDPKRAFQYACAISKERRKTKVRIKTPFVIGAVIDLGHCLDLLDSNSLEILKQGYEILRGTNANLPRNKPVGKEGDLLLRHLDCAVIQTVHAFNENEENPQYDSVRGAFFEGKDLYPNAGFKEKTHIQICLRNPNCIKGYFLPRELNNKYSRV